MGKAQNRKVIFIDYCFSGSPEVKILEKQGHELIWFSTTGVHLILSPVAYRCCDNPSLLSHVVERLASLCGQEVEGDCEGGL